MAYGTDLAGAAQRHFDAAEHLNHPAPRGKRDVAGYLYGIAAECALKQIMQRSNMRPVAYGDDPFYMHFPEIKTALLDTARGRHMSRLHRHANNGSLMSEWDIRMRYAGGPEVLQKPIDRWRDQARELVREMHEL